MLCFDSTSWDVDNIFFLKLASWKALRIEQAILYAHALVLPSMGMEVSASRGLAFAFASHFVALTSNLQLPQKVSEGAAVAVWPCRHFSWIAAITSIVSLMLLSLFKWLWYKIAPCYDFHTRFLLLQGYVGDTECSGVETTVENLNSLIHVGHLQTADFTWGK